MKEKKEFRFPSTSTLLMCVTAVMWLLTYIVPAGQFDRALNEATGREGVVAGSFHYIEQSPVNIGQLFQAPYWGLMEVIDIIALVFIVGGAVGVIIESGAIHAGINKIAQKTGGKGDAVFVILMLAFGAASTFLGLAEEFIVFVPLLTSIAISLGYDKITAVAVILLGVYGAGGFALFGPYNTMIAQKVAEVELLSGMGLRAIGCLGCVAISIHHVLRYGKKIKNDPTASLLYDKNDKSLKLDEDKVKKDIIDLSQYELTPKRKATLFVLIVGLIIMAIGVLKWAWWFEHMSALFLVMAIICGLINFNLSFDKVVNCFVENAAGMATVAILLALSRSIVYIITEGQIIDTIIYAISIPLSHLSGVLAAWGIYISQLVVNFFIPSSSGQAMVVMPILTPLADLIGVSRQVAVHAFTAGDYFGNMIIPTHPTTLACLAIAGIPYNKWFKYVLPCFLKWSAWVLVVLAIGVMTNWAF
ncbi:MAG: YfcC family protein [Firmicutes bacterium]|nr:YfcC family protein [Bacillota bacterium]